MACLDCSCRAYNPEETQIWEGENESLRSRQHLVLQLLLVIAAFYLTNTVDAKVRDAPLEM